MDVLATLRANDTATGELVCKMQAVFTCDECEGMEGFEENHGADIDEYFENALSNHLPDGVTVITRLDLIELEDEDNEEDEDSELFNFRGLR